MPLRITNQHSVARILNRPLIAPRSEGVEPELNDVPVLREGIHPALAALLTRGTNGRVLADLTTLTNGLSEGVKIEFKQNKPNVPKFKEYVHPTPEESIVLISGRGDETRNKLTIKYDPAQIPDPSKVSRSEIELEAVSPQIIDNAKLIVQTLKCEWERGNELEKQYRILMDNYWAALSKRREELSKYSLATDKRAEQALQAKGNAEQEKQNAAIFLQQANYIKPKLEELLFQPNSNRTTIEIFEKAYRQGVGELRIAGNVLPEGIEDDKSLMTLVSYFCLKKNNGFFEKIPERILDEDDENLIAKVQLLGRYFIVNQKGRNTAKKIEDFSEWAKEISNAGVNQLHRIFSLPDLLKVIFPGYLDGPNPPIREWLIQTSKKWDSGNPILLDRACKNVFWAQGVVRSDGTINNEEVLKKDWAEIVYSPKYGLTGALRASDRFKCALDLIRIAVPDLIGIKESQGQIPPWKFDRLISWKGEEGLQLLDQLTKYIVEEKLKLIDEYGKVSAEKIKQVTDWFTQYDNEVKMCLRATGVGNAYEALKRVYPDKFGWNDGQIQPGEIRYSGMWNEENGERLFRLRFAKSIHTVFEKLKEKKIPDFEKHTVRFDLDKPLNPLYITRRDFLSLKDYYLSSGISWWSHLEAFNLFGGASEVAGNIQSAFEILLGKINKRSKKFGDSDIYLNDLIDRSPSSISLVSKLLRDLPKAVDEKTIQLVGLRKNPYLDSHTGIEGTCLEPIFAKRAPSIKYIKPEILYKAYAASVIPSPTKDSATQLKDRFTALEKILIAVYPTGGEKNKPILPANELRYLLRILRDDIIDNVTLEQGLKQELKHTIDELLNCKQPSGITNEILLTAIETDKKYGSRSNLLGALNIVLEHVFEVIAIHEIRYERLNGHYSGCFDKILGNIEIVEPDEAEPETGSETEVVVPVDVPLTEDISEEGENENTLMSSIFETRNICEGNLSEATESLERLIAVSRNEKLRRRMFSLTEEGDPTVQLRILHQLAAYDFGRQTSQEVYAVIRAKVLPTTDIDLILGKEDSQINTDKIDKELFSNIPDWWPFKNNEPLMIPVLCLGSKLHVIAKLGYAEKLMDFLNSKLIGRKVVVKIVSDKKWEIALKYFRENFNRSGVNSERKAVFQFVSQDEEKKILENLSELRKIVKRFAPHS